MLGGSFFTGLENDPFFANHREHMRRMDAMFDPFGYHQSHRRMLGITDGQNRHDVQQRVPPERSHYQQQQQQQLQPFGMFGPDIFGSMFSNMRNMMADMQRGFAGMQNGPGNVVSQGQQGHQGHGFSQTSFMSYSNTGNSTPKVYQASSSTRSVPGGVMEVKKTVRDSESGVEKISVGHHIHDRGHVMERSRNRRTGEEEQNQNFLNIDENDAETFDREFKEKVSQTRSHVSTARLSLESRQRGPHPGAARLALTPPDQHTDTRRHPPDHKRSHNDTHHPMAAGAEHKRHSDMSRPVSGGAEGKRPSSAEVTRRLWADANKRHEAKRPTSETDGKRRSGGEGKRPGGVNSKHVGFAESKRHSGVEKRRNVHSPSKSYRDRE